ncbi:MAG: CaiB/BaiF CoA transferase family protein [Pseudomonadales bacterium]
MAQAFSGLRIVDFTQVLAGPFATQQLALLGAEVIKIELPGNGDMTRALTVGGNAGDSSPGMTASFMTCNLGKRSITLDLKAPAAGEVVRRLVAQADAVVENFKPGTMERLGCGYEALRQIKPDLVYCSISGYGQSGPKSGLPAFDGAIQASSGMMSITGHPESGPTRTGFFAVDMSTALHAAFALSAALYRKQATGEGQRLDVSMLDTALMMQAPQVASTALTGRMPTLNGNSSPTREPTANVFPATDGFLQISALKAPHIHALLVAIDREDLTTDARLATTSARIEHADFVRQALSSALSQQPLAHWLSIFHKAGIPCAPIQTLAEVSEDPQLDQRDILVPLPHPKRDGMTQVVGPGHSANVDAPDVSRPPPALGQHTEEILREIGYDSNAIAALMRDKIV